MLALRLEEKEAGCTALPMRRAYGARKWCAASCFFGAECLAEVFATKEAIAVTHRRTMTDNAVPRVPLSSTAALDQQFHAALAKMTSSLSIASAALAGLDWGIHLAVSPGKRIELAMLALRQSAQ
eukprot:gene47294-61325_t